jgi:signal transduction histidine kinase
MLSEIPDSSKLLGDTSRPALLRYGFAVLAVLLALLIRWPLQPLLGLSAPFLFFFPAIMAAAWYGRLGPGLLATALSVLASGVLFLEPVGLLTIAGLPGQVQLVLFGSIGVFISLLNEALHREKHRVEEAAARLLRAQEEARKSEERFRIAAGSAEEANRAKDDFLAVVSHELRTPLNAMMGWAQILLAADADPERRQKGLETIVRNGRLQAQLIDDLLDVSRIITGKMRLDVRPVELVPVIDAAIESIRPAAEAKQISLRRILDPLAGPVAGDPSRLQQVVWNLLANAVKFTPKGGKVEVRLERVNSHVEILVADTGIGIGPAFLPHVFDRFRQLDNSIKRQHGGLGLGLAIVRHLIELHGGTVRAKSPGDGQGSTFIVMLPVSGE